MHLIYLHGFASSARSSKAGFFKARAAERGVDLLTPDFNEPDFAGLTITRMVTQVSQTARDPAAGPGEPGRLQPWRFRRPAGGASAIPIASIVSCCSRRRSTSPATG